LNLIRSAIIMAGTGLRTFVEYYGSDLRYAGKEFAETDRWRMLIGNGVNMVDAKLSDTKIASLKGIALNAARAARDLAEPTRPTSDAWRQYHLSYHLLRRLNDREYRKGFPTELSGSLCLRAARG
jgi:hypothetical protein